MTESKTESESFDPNFMKFHVPENKDTALWDAIELYIFELRKKNWIDVTNSEENDIKDKIWEAIEEYEVFD